jgi:hypothetical protein
MGKRCIALVILSVLGVQSEAFCEEASRTRVLIPAIQTAADDLAEKAEEIARDLESIFAGDYEVLGMSDVGDFDVGYKAVTYVLSCPEGNYPGCAYVVGTRVEADWVVGGVLSRVDEDIELLLSFVDGRDGNEAFSLSILLSEPEETGWLVGVQTLLGHLNQGNLSPEDVRSASEEEQEIITGTAEEQVAHSTSLDVLEDEFGEVEAMELRPRSSRVRLSEDDLDRLEQRQDMPPWERLDMGRSEYQNYKKSGATIEQWGHRKQGREGQLLLRIAGSGGYGAYQHVYDGWYLLDGLSLDLINLREHVGMTYGAHGAFDLEWGVGLLPWFELGAAMTIHTSPFSYVINQQIENALYIADAPQTVWVPSYGLTIRGTAAPFPTSVFRPTMTAGLGYWSGMSESSLIESPSLMDVGPTLTTPWYVFLEMGPGVEVSVSKGVNLYARVMAEFPLGGGLWDGYDRDESGVIDPLDSEYGYTVGVSGQVGLLIRMGPLWKKAQLKARVERDNG